MIPASTSERYTFAFLYIRCSNLLIKKYHTVTQQYSTNPSAPDSLQALPQPSLLISSATDKELLDLSALYLTRQMASHSGSKGPTAPQKYNSFEQITVYMSNQLLFKYQPTLVFHLLVRRGRYPSGNVLLLSIHGERPMPSFRLLLGSP